MEFTESFLKRIFKKLNKKYFNGELETPTFEWSTRMVYISGICITGGINGSIIRLSKDYIMEHPDDLENVLVHEMIHLIPHARNHSEGFKKELKRVNMLGSTATRYCKRWYSKVRHVYYCTNCYQTYYMAKRLTPEHSCGVCRTLNLCEITIPWKWIGEDLNDS